MNDEHQKPLHHGRDDDDLGPADLGIDLAGRKPAQVHRWFLASLLFGRPIQQTIAANTYRALIDEGFTSAGAFAKVETTRLSRILHDAGYGRFDTTMADALHEAMRAVETEYGSVEKLVEAADDRHDLERRLQELQGVGPKVTEIFLKELPDAPR